MESHRSHQSLEVGEEEMHTEVKMEESVRKRHLPMDNTDSLETKFAREAEKIIKLRVNADAVNWELKERIKGLEATKDRQQQNLVQLQREYEALDSKLQNELRNREIILNKMSNTRQICAAVERHASSAMETLAGCERNRETLSNGYESAASAINALREQFQEYQKRQQLQLRALEDRHAGEVKIHEVSQEKWAMQIKQNEDIIAHLKKENDLQVELNNVHCLKIEKAIKKKEETIETLIKQNDVQKDLNNLHIQKIEEVTKNNEETKRFLIMKTEEIVSLNAQHALFIENSAQKITELDMKIKDSNILMQAKEKELERINLLLTEEKDNNDKLRETEELMKREYEEAVTKLGVVEELYRKQSEKMDIEMKANSEFNILSEKLKESLESQKERCDESNKRLDKSEAELEEMKRKYKEDMSALQANLTSVTKQLDEKVRVADEEMRKKEENLSSLSDTINSLMSQLTANTEARAKVETANQQLRQERQILSDLHKETEIVNEKRHNMFTEDFEKLKKLCDDKIIECENLIKMNTFLKNELASQKTYKVETKKVPDIKPDRKHIASNTQDTAHVESSTVDAEFKSNPVSVKNKLNPIMNLTAVKLSKGLGAKKTEDKDAFLSDSSFEGFVYDMNLVKQHYSNMKSIPYSEQPNSTTKPRSDQPNQERESKIPKKRKKIFSFVKNQ